jgi:hypothetical protein
LQRISPKLPELVGKWRALRRPSKRQVRRQWMQHPETEHWKDLTDSDSRPISVNLAMVRTIQREKDGTLLKFAADHNVLVKESVKDILSISRIPTKR